MDNDMRDLLSVPQAAKRAGVARNTMLLAAKHGTIKSIRLGRIWYVYGSDIERWKKEAYRPEMAHRYPIEEESEESSE
jgi:excisionase family DNA binding protein